MLAARFLSAERLYTISVLLVVGASYFWVVVPEISQYSLQLFAVCLAVFLLLHRRNGGTIRKLFPQHLSVELLLITAAFLVLLGSTSGILSPFFPLTFLYIFALVFATPSRTSIPVMGALVLFFYALSPELSMRNLVTLGSIPLMVLLLLLGKSQYHQVQTTQILLQKETETLSIVESSASTLESFLQDYLYLKLAALEQLSQQNATTMKELTSQISLLKTEVEKILKRSAV